MIAIICFCLVSFFLLWLLYYLYRSYCFYYQKYITSNTVVLITGGCMGIGKEIINELITRYKCKIINIDIQKEKFISHPNITNIYCDLSHSDINFKALLKLKNIDISSIDIIINNAGIAYNYPFTTITKDQLKKTLNVNLLSPMMLTKEVISSKKDNKHIHIVTMASVMSHIISQNSSDYVTSKWGLFAFHESIRAEFLYRKDFSFTIFCPYAVDTGMFPGFKNPIPILFRIFSVKEIARDIVKSIVLKDKVVYYPCYANIICGLYKMIPTFISDAVQYVLCKYIYIMYSWICNKDIGEKKRTN